MRITNNMLSQNLLRNLEAAQGRIDRIQNQMASGLRISKPSDDPVGIENALRLKSTITAVDQWQNNANEAISFMETTETVLGDVNDMLQRVRELAVQGANGTVSPENMKSISEEVRQLKEQIRNAGNTKVGSKYIFAFGGINPGQSEPISADYKWQGNGIDTQYPVGNGLKLSISSDGEKAFAFNLNGEDKNIFGVLDTLIGNLDNGNSSEVSKSLGELDQVMDNITDHRAAIGARTNRMTTIRDQLEATSLDLTENLTKLQDADMAKTIIEFKNQENVYRAALSTGAQIIQPSLVDFLR